MSPPDMDELDTHPYDPCISRRPQRTCPREKGPVIKAGGFQGVGREERVQEQFRLTTWFNALRSTLTTWFNALRSPGDFANRTTLVVGGEGAGAVPFDNVV